MPRLALPWRSRRTSSSGFRPTRSSHSDDNTRITLEQIARFSDRQDGLYTTEIGALVGQRVSKNFELGFGYRHVAFYNGNTGADENRFRQQVVGNFGRLSTRLRIDERFHPAGDEVGIRIRPLVRFNQPINRKGLAVFVSHESFFIANSTKWGQRRGYERMRNWLGLVLPISPVVSADLAYLNQYRLARGGARAQMDHALNLQLYDQPRRTAQGARALAARLSAPVNPWRRGSWRCAR